MQFCGQCIDVWKSISLVSSVGGQPKKKMADNCVRVRMLTQSKPIREVQCAHLHSIFIFTMIQESTIDDYMNRQNKTEKKIRILRWSLAYPLLFCRRSCAFVVRNKYIDNRGKYIRRDRAYRKQRDNRHLSALLPNIRTPSWSSSAAANYRIPEHERKTKLIQYAGRWNIQIVHW